MLKRSWLSIRRKIGRTIVLTLIFFIMANLVLAAITIKSAVAAQMDYAKSTLGGTVTIQADMEAIRENQREQMESGVDRREMFGKMSRPKISIETANEIASYSDYVKDYSYEISSSANEGDLEIVESNNGPEMPGMPGMPGRFQNSNNSESAELDGNITISGINAYAYISGVENESFTIKDGTYFDEDSDDKALISYEFAELNDLKVDDTFEIKNVYTSEIVKLSVIGVYDSSDPFAGANTIYMNIATAAKFLSSDDYNDGNFDVNNANFYMINSDKADEFVEKINSDFPELAENNLKIAVDTSEYDSMSGSIESVGGFATTILVIVIIAAIVIITLIVTLNVRDRRYEMGVLLSLGAHKFNVVTQIATELAIVGTLGFALASISGTFLAKSMGQGIIDSQTASSQAQLEKNFGRPGNRMPGQPNNDNFAPGNNDSREMNMKQRMMANNEQKVELDINATPSDFLILFATGYLVIILALILPSVNIMRYQPKEILAGKE
ncbi:MAG: ABC transporter permease [Candidatus Saccharibacteria bacterium]|nr:ABC transporter permease [Candidatus Saccharibacteria bacterium]